jgi:hypothetical protein
MWITQKPYLRYARLLTSSTIKTPPGKLLSRPVEYTPAAQNHSDRDEGCLSQSLADFWALLGFSLDDIKQKHWYGGIKPDTTSPQPSDLSALRKHVARRATLKNANQ